MPTLDFHLSPTALAALIAGLAATSTAQAHISLEAGGTHLSRYGDGDANIKFGPCGHENGQRGTHIYEYKPGETITVTVVETIAHPGYFRIAFDDDGDDGFVDPQSIEPLDPNRVSTGKACGYNDFDKCGTSDFFNNDTVLMDNLDPHVPSLLDTFAGKSYTWQVTLPDVECDNCTLQVIQVMEDTVHGPYCPRGVCDEGGDYVEDVYHQCIDLVLKADADSSNNPPPAVDPATGSTGGTTGTTGATTDTTATGGTTTGSTGATALDGSMPMGTGTTTGSGDTAGSSSSGGCNAGGDPRPLMGWLAACLFGTWLLWRRGSARGR